MSGNSDDTVTETFPHFATLAIHAGQEPEQWNSMAVVPPISLATTFKQYGPNEDTGYCYARSGTPTRTCLEKCLAALEDAKYALVFSSGLAASMTIVHLLQCGDHIVSVNDVYGGTNRYFQKVVPSMGISTTFVEATDVTSVMKAIKPNTKLVWLESPTNPTLKVVDIQAICSRVREQSEAFTVVDNTFMSSYFQRPLALGADIVLHSLTKYMNGHTDVVMGSIMTNNDEYFERLKFLQNAAGAVPSPFDCYLVNRGLKTLPVRMREHHRNGLAVAHFLDTHPNAQGVIHPGLPSHPQYELSRKQCKGYSGMVSFYVRGGMKEARAFMSACKVFTLAESLGGYESLIDHPATMTHAAVPDAERDALGISDSLVRLSVGLEDTQDLLDDLDQALNVAVGK